MKLLVLSDNHGQYDYVKSLIAKYRPNVDYIIHCGDSEFRPDDPIWQSVDVVVKGNMDFYPAYPDQEILKTPYGKLFITHGHLYQVNWSDEGLRHAANQVGASIVLHGHTHCLRVTRYSDCTLINPGSVSRSRGAYPDSTYALITLDESGVTVDYYSLTHEKIKELSQQFEWNEGE